MNYTEIPPTEAFVKLRGKVGSGGEDSYAVLLNGEYESELVRGMAGTDSDGGGSEDGGAG